MKKIFAAILLCAVSASFAQAQATAGAAAIEQAPDTVLWIVNPGATAVGNVAGIEFKSAAGNLVPVPARASDPFDLIVRNIPTNIVLGNLGTTIELGPNSRTATAAKYNGDAAGGDLQAFLGVGVLPIAIPIVPEPATGLMAAFAGLGVLGFRRRR